MLHVESGDIANPILLILLWTENQLRRALVYEGPAYPIDS